MDHSVFLPSYINFWLVVSCSFCADRQWDKHTDWHTDWHMVRCWKNDYRRFSCWKFFPLKFPCYPPPLSSRHTPVMGVVVVICRMRVRPKARVSGPESNALYICVTFHCCIPYFSYLFKCSKRYSWRLNLTSRSRAIDTFVSSLHLLRLIFEALIFSGSLRRNIFAFDRRLAWAAIRQFAGTRWWRNGDRQSLIYY